MNERPRSLHEAIAQKREHAFIASHEKLRRESDRQTQWLKTHHVLHAWQIPREAWKLPAEHSQRQPHPPRQTTRAARPRLLWAAALAFFSGCASEPDSQPLPPECLPSTQIDDPVIVPAPYQLPHIDIKPPRLPYTTMCADALQDICTRHQTREACAVANLKFDFVSDAGPVAIECGWSPRVIFDDADTCTPIGTEGICEARETENPCTSLDNSCSRVGWGVTQSGGLQRFCTQRLEHFKSDDRQLPATVGVTESCLPGGPNEDQRPALCACADAACMTVHVDKPQDHKSTSSPRETSR